VESSPPQTRLGLMNIWRVMMADEKENPGQAAKWVGLMLALSVNFGTVVWFGATLATKVDLLTEQGKDRNLSIEKTLDLLHDHMASDGHNSMILLFKTLDARVARIEAGQ
jgi:hypothetical protein